MRSTFEHTVYLAPSEFDLFKCYGLKAIRKHTENKERLERGRGVINLIEREEVK